MFMTYFMIMVGYFIYLEHLIILVNNFLSLILKSIILQVLILFMLPNLYGQSIYF